MPSASVARQMPVPSAEVFDLLHNYDRRLEWDTLLREARLTRGHLMAAKGATSLCVGKPFFGFIGVETEYLTFSPGKIAAVKMINSPPFFEFFAASIRHEDNEEGSRATYKFNFAAKPRFLRWIMEPVMLTILKLETKKRLDALARHLTDSSSKKRRVPTKASELLAIWTIRLNRFERMPPQTREDQANLTQMRNLVATLQKTKEGELIDLEAKNSQFRFFNPEGAEIAKLRFPPDEASQDRHDSSNKP